MTIKQDLRTCTNNQTFCLFSIAATTHDVYHTRLLYQVGPNLVSTLHTRLGIETSKMYDYMSFCFAGILDDATVVGRPGYAFANAGHGPSMFVTLFPGRKTPGHVDNVGELPSVLLNGRLRQRASDGNGSFYFIFD